MASITHQPTFTDVSLLPVASYPGTPTDGNSIASTPKSTLRGVSNVHAIETVSSAAGLTGHISSKFGPVGYNNSKKKKRAKKGMLNIREIAGEEQ